MLFIISIFYGLVGFVAIILNGLVIFLYTRYSQCDIIEGSVLIMYFRHKSLKKPINLVIVNLSISGLMMMGKVPVFFINLLHSGPYTGVLGAKV